ncbi:DUF4397 domain-containing protein [Georgenia faecalis]|uniref:DUF4397 domain-containing protein n=1 Tax=Georgenia faecalis TaxID=2483799 RepID=UPI000FDB6B15|nr:DUF4397 domain-containing protein [Georgenia faecalis]
MSRTTTRRSLIGLGTVVAAAGLTLTGATTATADTADQGWVRLAHLSPDTPAVDVELTGVDSAEGFELEDVAYGDVSTYSRLPAGAYAVAMVPAGAPEGTDPLITQVIEISGDQAYTAAAVGLNEDLSARVITDDLTPAAAGQARVRLIQASISSSAVDVATDTGMPIAEGVEFGTATAYTEVEAGRWTLEVDGATQSGTVQVDLEPASVNTLFVLDRDGEISISAVQDSSGAQEMPAGGVATGEGGLYYAEQARLRLLAALGLGAVLLAGAALVVVRRRATV